MADQMTVEMKNLLVTNAEIAIRKGCELVAWWISAAKSRRLKFYELMPPVEPSTEVMGFHDSLGKDAASVMGMVHRTRFENRGGEANAADLEWFVQKRFLREAL